MGVAWSGVLPYALAISVAGAIVRTRRLREREPGPALRQRLGIVLLTAPVVTLLGVGLASLPTLIRGATGVAASPDLLASKALLHLSLYLAVPLAGLILVLGQSFWTKACQALAPSRERLVEGMRVGAGASALLAGAVGALWAVSGGDGGLLAVDGASVFFSQTTPLVALALSLIAAVAEELCFRGVLLDALKTRAPTSLAVGVQALAFGLIHAGYGSILHVLAATTFGLLVGVLALRYGLVPAIGTHVAVNLVILSLWSGHAILLAPAALVLAGLLAGARLVETFRLPVPGLGAPRVPSSE
jgi:membrane protease YdiL (CAAX protease family)